MARGENEFDTPALELMTYLVAVSGAIHNMKILFASIVSGLKIFVEYFTFFSPKMFSFKHLFFIFKF